MPDSDIRDLQLAVFRDRFETRIATARALLAPLSAYQANWKPAHDRWSVAECFRHLNETGSRYAEAIREAVEQGRERGQTGTGPFEYGWVGRTFVRAVTPGSRPMRTWGSMKPPPSPPDASELDAEAEVRRFVEARASLVETCARADGLDLSAIRMRSPVFPLLRLPVIAFLDATAAHDARHLEQAAQVTHAPDFPHREGR
jgi:hypothetical protein